MMMGFVGGHSRPLAAPLIFASIGDSTAWQGTAGATGSQYTTYGLQLWLRALTNFRSPNICPIPNNLAASGSYIDQMSLQIPSLDGLAIPPTDVIVQSGTNDLAGSAALATMQSQYATRVASVLAKPTISRVWIVPITPRTAGSGMNSTLYQRRKDFNAWLAGVGSGDSGARAIWLAAAAGTTTDEFAKLRILDVSFATDVDEDNPISGYVVADGLHYTPLMARGLADQIATWVNSVVAPSPPARTYPADLFNASTLPTGSLLRNGGVNRGLMGGTTGNKTLATGITPTGDVATGFRLYRTAGSSTATLVASKEATVDGRSGQIITYTASDAGLSSEACTLEYLGGAFGISTADGLTNGDVICFEGEFEVLSNTGILKAVTFTLGAKLDWTANMPLGFSTLGPYWFRTPPYTVSVTDLVAYVNGFMDTSGGGGEASYVIRDLKVRRV
jgi:hypothetical protein